MPRTNPNLLLVEGKDDQHVVYALRDRHRIPDCFEVFPSGGIEPLLQALPHRLLESARERIGVVVDADIGVGPRWAALRRVLKDAGYDGVPKTPAPTGTIVPAPDVFLPRVGLWIMPDNRLEGALEHFLASLIPEADVLFPRARVAVQRIPLAERPFPAERRIKAEIYTWLAWQQEPGRPFGTSITTRVLDADREPAKRFAGWLRALLELDDVEAPDGQETT